MSKKSIKESLANIQSQYIQNATGLDVNWVALDSKIELLDNIASKELKKELKEDKELLEEIEKAKKIIAGRGSEE
ncbi:hypothetical protein NAT51_15440 [Flavobacterium amniphilum]|uniref:hypothetical protein n=1 Tax=Flavobacterium amniphilum TaxID=1834035 RepID=UPI00202A323D|nr:hypothetical protein [Flavobacterium amniphilum]MCL9806929.1 hypothetical protein [Flavobacterium amniphilum]